MAGIKYLRSSNSVVDLTGEQYTGITNGTAKLYVKTGIGAEATIKYGFTTDVTASAYSPKFRINNTFAYIASSSSSSEQRTTGTSYGTESYINTTYGTKTVHIRTTITNTTGTSYATTSNNTTSYATGSQTTQTGYQTITYTYNTYYYTRSSTYISDTRYEIVDTITYSFWTETTYDGSTTRSVRGTTSKRTSTSNVTELRDDLAMNLYNHLSVSISTFLSNKYETYSFYGRTLGSYTYNSTSVSVSWSIIMTASAYKSSGTMSYMDEHRFQTITGTSYLTGTRKSTYDWDYYTTTSIRTTYGTEQITTATNYTTIKVTTDTIYKTSTSRNYVTSTQSTQTGYLSATRTTATNYLTESNLLSTNNCNL